MPIISLAAGKHDSTPAFVTNIFYSIPYTNLSSGLFWSGILYFGVYGLLAKKILPKCTWRTLSQLYFWPMLPLTFLLRNLPWSPPYYVEISPGVLLGAVPLICAGHVDELHRLGVRGVVNMQAEYGGPVQKYEQVSTQCWYSALLLPPVSQLL